MTKRLRLRRGDRRVLESWLDPGTAPPRLVDRARIILAAADGRSSRAIADSLGVARATVRLWTSRYEAEGLPGVETDRPRSGRPRKSTPEVQEQILRRTVNGEPPAGASRDWSSRLLGEAFGLSHVTVWRVWKSHGLEAKQVRDLRLWRDPALVGGLRGFEGLYLSSADHVAVFSMDETGEETAVEPGTSGSEDVSLRASLEGALGHLGDAHPGGRGHRQILAFLGRIEGGVDTRLGIHAIFDNHAAYQHDTVRRWLERHPRVRLHFVPTGASWLDLVERLGHRTIAGVGELVEALDAYRDHRNHDPAPFCWARPPQTTPGPFGHGSETLVTNDPGRKDANLRTG